MRNVKAVIFDVDGVLLDSLESHLKICRDLNYEYSLGLHIPNKEEFKEIVQSGKKVSPMRFFFKSVGFPDSYAESAADYYNKYFIDNYPSQLFEGVGDVLEVLSSAGFGLGMVTSNVRKNVIYSLSSCLEYFPPKCILAKDDYSGDSKSDAILLVAGRLGVQPSETVYIGDQISDKLASDEAGVQFAGVKYGWGFSGVEREFPVFDNLLDIAKSLAFNRAALN